MPPILTTDFAVFIQRWPDGSSLVEPRSNWEWPGIINPNHVADCAALGVAPERAFPYWQITLITEGTLYSTFDNAPEPVLVKQPGSQPWRVMPCQHHMTTVFAGDAEAHCLIPRESPPTTFYERETISLSAGGTLNVRPKPTTHWFWLAKGSLHINGRTLPPLTMIKLTPGNAAGFEAEGEALLAHIWT
jgi:hypothetical protein